MAEPSTSLEDRNSIYVFYDVALMGILHHMAVNHVISSTHARHHFSIVMLTHFDYNTPSRKSQSKSSYREGVCAASRVGHRSGGFGKFIKGYAVAKIEIDICA